MQYLKRTVGESHICLDLNGVFGGKTCRGLRIIGVNFHICLKRACVKISCLVEVGFGPKDVALKRILPKEELGT